MANRAGCKLAMLSVSMWQVHSYAYTDWSFPVQKWNSPQGGQVHYADAAVGTVCSSLVTSEPNKKKEMRPVSFYHPKLPLQDVCLSICVSVCPFVTRQYAKTAKCIVWSTFVRRQVARPF